MIVCVQLRISAESMTASDRMRQTLTG
jgi:hypothetical protein